MGSISIRLSPEDLAKVRALRKQSVNISELVRDAVRAEHQRRAPPRPRRRLSKREMEAIFAEIYAKYPDPKDMPPKTFNPHDRHEFREMIRNKIRRGRRP